MILKGAQRAGAFQLARHLLNDRDNDHVTLHALRGFVADDLEGALAESHAIAKGTKCRQFLFSLSLSPPKGAVVGEDRFERAVDEAEKTLGLVGQPRAVIFHEKEGRRHAHVVWSRIDVDAMRAINLPFFKTRLTALSRALYLEHDWTLPDGLRADGGKSPLDFTLAEWQQGKRLDLDAREIKQSFQEAWAQSDGQKAFASALMARGYVLAQGDRRGFVALDVRGEVFSVSRYANVKPKELTARLGDPAGLPTVETAKADIARKVTDKLLGFVDEIDARHRADRAPLRADHAALIASQRAARAAMRQAQDARWKAESNARAARLHKGLRGLWQRLTGKAGGLDRRNAIEAAQARERDREERERLVLDQAAERAPLHAKLERLRERQRQNRRVLTHEIARHLRGDARRLVPTPEHEPRPRRSRRGPSHDL